VARTYNETIPTDKDWVRLTISDRDVSNAVFDDEEIQAVLDESANKWLAAARLGELLLTRNGGVVWKQVGELRIKFDDSETEESVYRSYLRRLRAYGCFVLEPRPKAFGNL